MTPTFTTVADAATKFKRCRKMQFFRLAADSPDNQIGCSVCGKPVGDFGDAPRGYRAITGHFFPRQKRFRLMHYMCSWGSLLGGIVESRSLAEAAVKVEAAQGRPLPL